MSIELFYDSGAASMYNLLSRRKLQNDKAQAIRMGSPMHERANDDYSYVDTPEYKEFRASYIEALKELDGKVSAYPNLDVINHAALTWKNQQLLESEGLSPLPVWHFGCDPKWLRRYISKGYDYICIGGMTPNPASVLMPGLDSIWNEHLTDDDGMPIVKVHGFAMTTFSLLKRYPWYSVDSKAWLDKSRFGIILMPRMDSKGNLDYLNHQSLFVSHRSFVGDRKTGNQHYRAHNDSAQAQVRHYFEDVANIPFGKSEFKKVKEGYELEDNEWWQEKPEDNKGKGKVGIVLEEGVSNSYKMRILANTYYFNKVEEALPDWPWAFKHAPKKGLF